MTVRSRYTLSAAALLTAAMVSVLHAQDITNKDLLDGFANPSRGLTHSGDYTGRRFSPLTQITPANVGQLAAQWTFQTNVVHKFEATPIVIDGILYANRGFIDAYDPLTGQRAWRFYTIPAPGEPGSDSWKGEIWRRGGGPTWLTGTYDPALNLLYWGTGNPNPDWDGESRPGGNLYTDLLVALDPDTGTLKWHFQYTPHDTHDWDANEVPVLADLTIRDRPRKVVMMSDPKRYGALRAIDPATGERKWEITYADAGWAGVLATAGGVVFSADREGTFFAADSMTGKKLYQFQTGAAIFAPPTSYLLDGRQYVVMPSGITLTAFALPSATLAPVAAGPKGPALQQ